MCKHFAAFSPTDLGVAPTRILGYRKPMQQGQVFKRNGAWHLRFYRDEMVDGVAVRKRVAVRLAPANDQYRSKKDLKDEIARHLAPVNTGALPEGGLTFADFYQHHFLPYVKSKRKASVEKFYEDAFRYHLKSRVGSIRLREFTTAHAQAVLDSIDLSHQSLLRIKTAMSAAFTVARQKDFIRSANPIAGAKAEGYKTNFKPYAYTLKEIGHMLTVLGEPARTVVAVAAFTGMREGEIRGLQWPDWADGQLHIRRSVWRTSVDEPKTEESYGTVPVIAPLRRMLEAHAKGKEMEGYIFAGGKKNFSLNLDNLTARDIRPKLGNKWQGWHAFRRGLATNLFEMGVPAETAKIILRHARVETTQRHYIVLAAEKAGKKAMRELEKAVNRAQIGQQLGNSTTRNKLPKNKKSPHK
jgi:integrase